MNYGWCYTLLSASAAPQDWLLSSPSQHVFGNTETSFGQILEFGVIFTSSDLMQRLESMTLISMTLIDGDLLSPFSSFMQRNNSETSTVALIRT